MVDSRAKGARNENLMKDKLIEDTGLNWKRTPSSGALDAGHGLKGDLYIPNEKNKYSIEVKAYKDEHFNSTILSSKESQIHKWWSQATRQAKQTDKKPLLLFKKDRGKWFVVEDGLPSYNQNFIYVSNGEFSVSLYDEWIKVEDVKWTL